MALYEKVYALANNGKIVAVMPGSTSQTDRNDMISSYRTRNTGGTYLMVEVPVTNLADFTDIDELIGKAVSNTGVISDYTPSDAIAHAQYQTDWKHRLYEAFLVYNDSTIPTSRQTWWPSTKSKLTGSVSNNIVTLVDPLDRLRATDIWIYHQVAIGDRLADRSYLAALSDSARTAALEHLETAIKTLGKTWYGVITGPTKTTDLTRWANASTAENTRLYTDLITSVGGIRSPDASYNELTGAGNTIAVGFTPDTPTLR